MAPHVRRGSSPSLLFVVMRGLYTLTVNPDPSPDAFTADFAAWHIAMTGEPVPDISDFPLLDDNIIRETWIVETADGREAVGRAPGVIAVAVPAYALARRGRSAAMPGAITAALLSAAAVALFHVLLRGHIGTRRALVAAGLFGLATPVWSVSADAMWPHTLTTLGIVGMAWAADRGRWWLVGSSVACCCGDGCTRRSSARWSASGWRGRGSGPRSPSGPGSRRVPRSRWCRCGRAGCTARGTRPRAIAQATSPARRRATPLTRSTTSASSSPPTGDCCGGRPLLLVLGPTAWRRRRDLPDWSRWLASGGAAYVVSQAVLNRFSGGDHFYGYRTSLELVVCLAPALALASPYLSERARRWFVPVAVLQVVLIAPGAISDDMYVPVRDVWWRNAFVDALVLRPTELLPLVAATMACVLAVVRVLHTTAVVRWLDRVDRAGVPRGVPRGGIRGGIRGSGPPSPTGAPPVPPTPEWHPPARRSGSPPAAPPRPRGRGRACRASAAPAR